MSSFPVSLRPAAAPPTSLPRDPLALADRTILVWLFVRTAAWALVALTQPNPPLDVVEWLAWGRQWQLGYHKHPPLAAWIADIAYRLTPGSFLGVYLAGYLAVGFAIFSVWRLARRVLPPRAALAATLCLDGLVFLGWSAAEFNNQVLLIAFWALAVERFHAAVTTDRRRDWLLTGVAFGLALLCKYSALTLLVPLAAWWLWHNGLRRWRGPAVALLTTAAVFLPHLAWMVALDFPTLRYAAARAEAGQGAFTSHLSGVSFLFNMFVRLFPALVILLPMLQFRRRKLGAKGALSRSLLLAAVAGPIALHLAAGLLTGAQLRDLWGFPLLTFAPLLLVLFVKTADGGRAWRRSRLLGIAVLTAWLAHTAYSNLISGAVRSRPLRVHFPGQLLADEVTSRYHERHGLAPAVIAGDWWLAGNVCCHAAHRPALYGSREPTPSNKPVRESDVRRCLAPEPITAPWTGDDDLNARGGVLLWDAGTCGEDMPPWLHQRFPRAQSQRSLRLPYHGGGDRSLVVGWAMVAPGGSARPVAAAVAHEVRP